MMVEQTFLQTMPSAVQHLPKAGSSPDNDPQKLKEACSDLESLFVYYLIKEMRATVPKTGLISGGKTEEMYTSMLDHQLAQEIAEKRGIGIAAAIFEKLYENEAHMEYNKAMTEKHK